MRNSIKTATDSMSIDYMFGASGYTECEKTHCHGHYEIFYVTSGFGKYILEGSECALSPNTLVISRPISYHFFSLDAEEKAERYIINFSDSLISEDALKLLNSMIGASDGICFNSLSPNKAVEELFEKVVLAKELPESEKESFVAELLGELFPILSDMSFASVSNLGDTLIPRVMRFINDNIYDDLHLDRISGHFFVNKCYLCRAFKHYNGVSVHTYINQKRVLLAKRLIEKGDSAASAADSVGFVDYSTFYRAYVKFFGKPPTNIFRGREVCDI